VDPEVLAIMRAVMVKLEHGGMRFVNVDLPYARLLVAKTGLRLVFHEAVPDIRRYLAASGAGDITVERSAAAIANPDFKAGFQAVIQRSPATQHEYANAISVFRPQIRANFEAFFKTNAVDAIFSPTTPMPAVRIDAERDRPR
jgi:mandelamide amidase